MFKELLFDLLFKGLEYVLAGVLGYAILYVLVLFFNQFVAIFGLSLIFYFFGGEIRPYVDNLRKFLFKKITGENDDENN